MGQKVNPLIFRISAGTIVSPSQWAAKGRLSYSANAINDLKIVRYLSNSSIASCVARFCVERKGSGAVGVILESPRSSASSVKKGTSFDSIKNDIVRLTGENVSISLVEVKNADVSASVVARDICKRIESRIGYKQVVKSAMESIMKSGASGVKIICSGRLNGAEMARSESFKLKSMPLHTLRCDIDYYQHEAKTIYGMLGVKVWIYFGLV